jgi:ATPase family associated with various cellular activities (AAA)
MGNTVSESKSETALEANSIALRAEMEWLRVTLETRINLYFGQPTPYQSIWEVPAPDLDEYPSIYSKFVQKFNMSLTDRLVVLLSLAPHVAPHLLDCFAVRNETNSQVFTEFGGMKGNIHRGFLPTCETAAFLLASNDLTRRFAIMELFDDDYYLIKQKILVLDNDRNNEPFMSSPLQMGKEYLSYLTTGAAFKPVFGSEFPAQRITTRLDWEDLVLEKESYDRIQEILNWIHYQTLILDDWGLGKVLKRGYRSLFYGPPGTGKTLTASLLGKTAGLDVYRVDISKVVSKYIGETEKNLGNIFDYAENKSWILFFDEADALFGKRTATSDSKDRYANQEVAYLLQRIEDFSGVVLLSTNLRSNIDPAFMRRFQSLVHFPVPSSPQRLRLWQQAFEKAPLEDSIDFKLIAKEYKISGGMIINVLRFCALAAVAREKPMIYEEDVIEGIRAEYRKEGKTV